VKAKSDFSTLHRRDHLLSPSSGRARCQPIA
jgi:hypothetical protein